MALTSNNLSNGGITTHYQFQYDNSLSPPINPGGPEPARTNAVIAACEGDLNLMSGWFGNIALDVNFTIPVNITQNSGGAGWSLSGRNLTITINPGTGAAGLIRYLLVSEMVEQFMRVQRLGWFGSGTEGSEGEGLSRFLAAQFLAANGLGNPPIASTNSNSWLSSAARADFVNNINPTDDGPDVITGCSLLFIYYLFDQLGFSVNAIVASGAPTLGGVYKNLTGDSNDPFPFFKQLIDTALPGTSTITTGNLDNPFPLGQLGQWHWSDQGAPGALGVDTAVGVVTVMDNPKAEQRPYVFVCGEFNLWVNWWDGTNWHWANQSAGGGPTVNGAVGAVSVMDGPTAPQRPYAFVIGAHDHYLWVNWWDGQGWQWANQLQPGGHDIVGAIGVVTVKDSPAASQRPYAFVQADDGHLWVNWWDGTNWRWSDQGTPSAQTQVAGPVGAITVQDNPNAAQRPYAFVLGTDRHLWVNWWDGAAWHWADQGTPAPAATLGPVGAAVVKDTPTSADRPYAFVHSGALHINWWDGRGWQWADQGTPNGSFIYSPTGGVPEPHSGVITVIDTPKSPQRPYAFVRDNNGVLWVNWWGGASWHWANQGTPAQNGVSSIVGACTVMNHPWDPQRPYAFVIAGSGHLWVNWWG